MAEWKSQALCRSSSVDTDWFFSSGGFDQTHRAITVCNVCPVRRDCLDFAIKNDAQGVWGGTTEIERKRLTQRRRISG